MRCIFVISYTSLLKIKPERQNKGNDEKILRIMRKIIRLNGSAVEHELAVISKATLMNTNESCDTTKGIVCACSLEQVL